MWPGAIHRDQNSAITLRFTSMRSAVNRRGQVDNQHSMLPLADSLQCGPTRFAGIRSRNWKERCSIFPRFNAARRNSPGIKFLKDRDTQCKPCLLQ